jgi:hypothetical protein
MPSHLHARPILAFVVVAIVLGCGLEIRDIASAGGLTLPRVHLASCDERSGVFVFGATLDVARGD